MGLRRAASMMSSGLASLGRGEDDHAGLRPAGQAESVALASHVVGPEEMPPRLAVPVYPFDGDGFGRLELQLIRSEDNLLATAFTTRALLVERLGPYQPWLGVASIALLKLLDASAVDGLVIDPAPHLVTALWTREALAVLRKINDVRL